MQLFSLFPEHKKNGEYRKKTLNKLRMVFSFLFLAINFTFIEFEIDPTIVISFIGAVICWFFCFFLPIIMKLGILKKKEEKDKSSLLSNDHFEEKN